MKEHGNKCIETIKYQNDMHVKKGIYRHQIKIYLVYNIPKQKTDWM